MSVEVSSLAYLTLFKSSAETHPDFSLGVLLGYDTDGTYHITTAFPLPAPAVDGEAEEAADEAAFVSEMMATLDRANFEGFPIGIYAAGNVGAFPSPAAFALAEKLKIKLIVLADLPVFKALRSQPRAFVIENELAVKELEVVIANSGAANALMKANASWLEMHVKPKNVRVQNFLERCLDNVGRLAASAAAAEGNVDTVKASPVEKFRSQRAAEALLQETHRAAKALLLP
jgi:hypothetical protein